MDNRERDQYVCEDYLDGKEINELARTYGLSERRISQIMQLKAISRRPRIAVPKKALSREHARIGIHLYNYRFNRGIEVFQAAKSRTPRVRNSAV